MPVPVRFHESVRDLLVPIEQVRQADRNPNAGDVEAIAESIEINGYVVPVIARRDTREIIAGNHRYAALHMLGANQIPVIWVDMTDEQAMRYLVADNRTTRLGTDDVGLLVELLDELSASEQALFGTGYDEDALERLHELAREPLSLEDLLPDAEPDAVQRRGHGAEITCPECGHTFSLGGQ